MISQQIGNWTACHPKMVCLDIWTEATRLVIVQNLVWLTTQQKNAVVERITMCTQVIKFSCINSNSPTNIHNFLKI